jgi:pyruvate kinase
MQTGDVIRVTPEVVLGTPKRITILYPNILQDLSIGDKIFINDGTVQLTVTVRVASTLVYSSRTADSTYICYYGDGSNGT